MNNMFIKALLLKVVKMSKIANMLNMIQILKDKKIHSIQSLAEKLEVSERIIHPAELFCYIDKWYVAAFCELRNEIRLFKLKMDEVIFVTHNKGNIYQYVLNCNIYRTNFLIFL